MLIENVEDSDTEQDEMKISKPISAYFFWDIFLIESRLPVKDDLR